MNSVNRKISVFGLAAVLAVVLLSVSLSVAFAQYQTEQTTNVIISANGVSHVEQSSTVGGVSIDIAGTPGVTGSVSTATYSANPQPDATVPADTTLTHFVVVTFNFAASDFQGASITISYSDSDVTGMSPPFVLYKYIPESNSYVKLDAVVDTASKTITTTVSSTTDPLFAIGGTTVAGNGGLTIPPLGIVSIAVILVVVVLLVVALVLRRRKPTFQLIES
jgi:hypothetical protein